jgi:hypothetical protein
MMNAAVMVRVQKTEVAAYRHTLGNAGRGSSSLALATGCGLIITSGRTAWENSFVVQ